jgi:hypothetical protein
MNDQSESSSSQQMIQIELGLFTLPTISQTIHTLSKLETELEHSWDPCVARFANTVMIVVKMNV